jgi:uncharacterized cupredoxin-like copper-binding protein
MRTLALMCACVIALGACGSAGTPSEPAAATASRAVATLAAPIATTAAASAAPASAAAATASVAPTTSPAAAVSSAPAAVAASVSPAAPPPVTAAPATQAPATPAPATAAPATAAPTAAAAFSGTIKVTLTDNAIKLDRTSAPAGPVTFSIANTGFIPHELIVLQTSIPQDQLPLSPTDPKTVQTPGQVGIASNIAAGASATLTLTLGAGPYDLICNIQSHYKDGMHTGLTILAAN